MRELNATAPLALYEINSGAAPAVGNLIALNGDGKAVPAADTAGLNVVGVAVRVDDGVVEIADGILSFANSGSAALGRADRGGVAYAADASTVAKSSTNKIAVGIVVDVYDGEVFVDCRPAALAAARAVVAAEAAAAAAAAK